MTKKYLIDITIPFNVVTPHTYDEFEKIFPGVFDELENPDHCHGTEGLRSLSVDFRTLRKGLGLVGNKRKLFHEWLTMFLDKHWDYWDLHGGTTLHYAQDENFEYNGRRWILVSRRWSDGRPKINPNEQKKIPVYKTI